MKLRFVEGGPIPSPIKAASIGVLLVAWLMMSSAQADAQCQFRKVAEFDLDLRNGIPVTPVTINGKQGNLVFANRSNTAFLYTDVAEKLGLKPYSTPFYSNNDGKRMPVYGVHIDDLRLGGMAPTDTEWFAASRPLPSTSPLWGVLSTFIFEGDAVDFDFPDRKIKLYIEKYCEGRLKAYWNPQLRPVEIRKEDLSTFMGEVDGTAIAIQINSSQTFSTINDAGVKAAKLMLENGSRQSGYSGQVAVIHRIDIAGEALSDLRLRLAPKSAAQSQPEADRPVGNSRTYDVNEPKIVLGVDYLLAHHVLISPIQHLIFISSTAPNPFGTITRESEGKPPAP